MRYRAYASDAYPADSLFLVIDDPCIPAAHPAARNYTPDFFVALKRLEELCAKHNTQRLAILYTPVVDEHDPVTAEDIAYKLGFDVWATELIEEDTRPLDA